MAFINKERVQSLKPIIIAYAKEKGFKVTVAGSNQSTLRVSIKSGPMELKHFIDKSKHLVNIYNEIEDLAYENQLEYMQENHSSYDAYEIINSIGYFKDIKEGNANRITPTYFRGAFKKFLVGLDSLIKTEAGWFDRSDSQTDYFNVDFYISINLIAYKFIPNAKTPKRKTSTNTQNSEEVQKELLNIIFSSTPGTWTNKKGEKFNTLILTQRVKKENWKAFTTLLKNEGIGYYSFTAKAIVCDKVEPTTPTQKKETEKDKKVFQTWEKGNFKDFNAGLFDAEELLGVSPTEVRIDNTFTKEEKELLRKINAKQTTTKGIIPPTLPQKEEKVIVEPSTNFSEGKTEKAIFKKLAPNVWGG